MSNEITTNERASLSTGRIAGGLVPTDIESLWRMALMFAKSGLMPKGCNTPEAVAVAIQGGLEIGLSPFQAVQSIAVINGRPSIFGDAALGLCMASGQVENIHEERLRDDKGHVIGARCTIRRKGIENPIVQEFTMDDAKRAKLAGKSGPWSEYPSRMLQMRARGFALRDAFPDVLKGLYLAEEAQDIQEPTAYDQGAQSLRDRLSAAKAAPDEDVIDTTAETVDEDPFDGPADEDWNLEGQDIDPETGELLEATA